MRTNKPGASQYRRAVALAAAVAVAVLLSGCNVFEAFHTPGSSDNIEDLLSDTHDALDQGQYRKAMTISRRVSVESGCSR
jgi:hypothetical protein